MEKKYQKNSRNMEKIAQYLNRIPSIQVVSACECDPTYLRAGEYVCECYFLLKVCEESTMVDLMREIQNLFFEQTGIKLMVSKQASLDGQIYWKLGFWVEMGNWDQIKVAMKRGKEYLAQDLKYFVHSHGRTWNE